MRDVEEVNARALASLADAPRRTARRRPRRARRVMRASWFVACVVALSAASRGAGAACAVESDGVRWCQVASSSTPSGLNITYAHAPGAATLDVRVRATFSGAHDPGSAGWIALGPGSGMMSGEVVVASGASGGAGSAATYYQLTGQSQPSTLCGAACALSAANVTAATGSRTVVVRYRDANASAGGDEVLRVRVVAELVAGATHDVSARRIEHKLRHGRCDVDGDEICDQARRHARGLDVGRLGRADADGERGAENEIFIPRRQVVLDASDWRGRRRRGVRHGGRDALGPTRRTRRRTQRV